MVRKLKLLNADHGFKVEASVEIADPTELQYDINM